MKTLVVYSCNRDQPQGFTRSIERLMLSGYPVIPQGGTVDVSLARNLALTSAVDALRGGTPVDVVLMVDDDMQFSIEDVEHISNRVRSTGHAASAAYVMRDGRLAARYVGPRWETGLGFLAMPAAQLLALAADSQAFVGKPDGGLVLEFTRSCVVERDGKRRWSPEDFYLCERLGGVDLLELRVAHLKLVPLMPQADTLAKLIAQHEVRPSPEEVQAFAQSLRDASEGAR